MIEEINVNVRCEAELTPRGMNIHMQEWLKRYECLTHEQWEQLVILLKIWLKKQEYILNGNQNKKKQLV